MFTWFLQTILPFLREIWAGESDLSKAIQRNKLSTLLFVVNMASIGLVFYMTDQMITKQENYTKLKTQIAEQVILIKELKSQPNAHCAKEKLADPDELLMDNITDLREYIKVLRASCKKE